MPKIIKMLKIGVLGVGHLGKIHLNCIGTIDDFDLVGFYDPDDEKAGEAIAKYGLKRFNTIGDLIAAVDAVDIVTPTISHYDCAVEAIKKSKHIFIEKPVSSTVAEAEELIELTAEAGVKVQVGHVERFNPAFLSVKDEIKHPMFIETHRLAQFNPRGTDVPVVLDLMIHDIDVVLHTVGSEVKRVHASGVNVVSDTPDIANARIEFVNGAVANLTASRISLKNMRKSRFFQRDAYITVDFLEKSAEVVKMNEIDEMPDDPFAMVLDLGEGKKKRRIWFDKPEVHANNAITEELTSFKNAILNNTEPPVSIYDGYKALKIAQQIMDKINAVSV